MKKTQIKRLLSLLVCIVLIAAMALITSGCDDKKKDDTSTQNSTVSITAEQDEVVKLGSGAVEIDVSVVDKDGNETKFKISTDKKTLEEAVVDVNLVAGEESEFGLYIKTVNGLTLDYDTDGMFWAIYVNGQSSLVGAGEIDVVAGNQYTFKAEK